MNIFQLLNTTANGVGSFGSFDANHGNTWTTGQLAALIAYAHKTIFKGASTGG